MKRINFDTIKPDFTNVQFKWYKDNHFNTYLTNKQARNLPRLKGLGVFIVKSDDIEDYVLINNKQEVISYYPYTFEGYGQMEAKINIIKVAKHFDDYEGKDI